MGQILTIEGADFSNNPNAINVHSLPVVTDELFAFFANSGVEVASDGVSVARMTSNIYGDMVLLPLVPERGPRHIPQGSYFKGPITSYRTTGGLTARGLVSQDPISLSLSNGISLTVIYRRAENSIGTTSSRLLFAFDGIEMQILACAPTSTPLHLQIGSGEAAQRYDLLIGNQPPEVEALTFVVLRSQIKTYRNGSLLSTVSYTTLPEMYEGNFYVGSNWNGSSSLDQSQVRQVYVHSKELTPSEVSAIHGSIVDLII